MATHSNVVAWRIPGMGEPGAQIIAYAQLRLTFVTLGTVAGEAPVSLGLFRSYWSGLPFLL